MFIMATILSQAFSILSNFALRYWSEDNRRTGDNRGITKYLALSGIAQLLSVMFLAIAMVSLLLLCALRSSKQLHGDVSKSKLSPTVLEGNTDLGVCVDVEFVDACAFIFLRTNTIWKVRVGPCFTERD